MYGAKAGAGNSARIMLTTFLSNEYVEWYARSINMYNVGLHLTICDCRMG